MKNKLDLPAELAHLVEKREQSERRGSTAKSAKAPKADDKSAKERRSGGDRRKS